MMNLAPFLNKLNTLETKTLQEIHTHLEGLLKGRLDTSVRVGRSATFNDKDGIERFVRVEQVNRVTANCIEITPVAGRKWRVSIGGLKISGVEKAFSRPAPSSAPHKPTSATGDIW